MVNTTGVIGTARAQYHLRQVMVFLNMFPLNRPEVMVGNANERFDTVGNLTDETREYVGRLVQSLADWTRHIGSKEEADGDGRTVARRFRLDEQGGADFLPRHQVSAG